MASQLAATLNQQVAYQVRVLTHDDDEQIYALQRANQAFFSLFMDHHLTQTEAVADLDNVATQAKQEQKHYLGFFDGDALVASLDLTIDYPGPKIVWVGQYLTDEAVLTDVQKTDLLNQVLETLRQLAAQTVQLILPKRDKAGQKFYEGLKFEAVSETKAPLAGSSVDVVVYQRQLS